MIDLAQVSPWFWAVAPLAVIMGYTVFGLTGFGATALTVPILAHFLPIAYLVPVMALLDLGSSILVGTSGRRHISMPELRNLVPFMLVGFVVGATVLVGVPDQWLRIALGVFAAIVGLYSILNPTLYGTISRLWCVPAGLAGGAIATIFGAGGPIYATYLSGRLRDKDELRSTVSTLISLSAFTRAIIYAVSGLLLHLSIFIGMLALAPFAWIGLAIGRRIHVGLTQAQMRRVVGGVMVLTGASLLLRVALP
jgi:uncharacterized membrane protein YfcA